MKTGPKKLPRRLTTRRQKRRLARAGIKIPGPAYAGAHRPPLMLFGDWSTIRAYAWRGS